MPRLFIAVTSPPELVQYGSDAIQALKAALRTERNITIKWTPPENLHLTLGFIGSVAPGEVPAFADVMGRAATKSRAHEAEIEALGAFPHRGSVQTLWLGIQDREGNLARLAAALADELRGIGFPGEDRPFVPHLTLGRVKQGRFPRALLEEFSGRSSRIRFRLHELALFESKTLPSGAVYRIVRRVELPEVA